MSYRQKKTTGGKDMNKDFLHRISENMHTFSKGQKRIGNFILSHYD